MKQSNIAIRKAPFIAVIFSLILAACGSTDSKDSKSAAAPYGSFSLLAEEEGEFAETDESILQGEESGSLADDGYVAAEEEIYQDEEDPEEEMITVCSEVKVSLDKTLQLTYSTATYSATFSQGWDTDDEFITKVNEYISLTRTNAEQRAEENSKNDVKDNCENRKFDVQHPASDVEEMIDVTDALVAACELELERLGLSGFGCVLNEGQASASSSAPTVGDISSTVAQTTADGEKTTDPLATQRVEISAKATAEVQCTVSATFEICDGVYQ